MKLLSGPHRGVFGEEMGSTPTQMQFYSSTLAHLYDVADSAFAAPTSGSGAPGTAERTQALTTADPEVIAATADAPVLRAVEQLRGWLNVSYSVVARLAGFRSPSLIHHWRRHHREGKPVRPRASSVEQLWRVHAVLRAITEALDGNDMGYGVQLWARSQNDGVSPLDLLLNGDVEAFEGAARQLLVDVSAREMPVWRYARPDDERELEVPVGGTIDDYGEADFG